MFSLQNSEFLSFFARVPLPDNYREVSIAISVPVLAGIEML
jgi:hypothetical protein